MLTWIKWKQCHNCYGWCQHWAGSAFYLVCCCWYCWSALHNVPQIGNYLSFKIPFLWFDVVIEVDFLSPWFFFALLFAFLFLLENKMYKFVFIWLHWNAVSSRKYISKCIGSTSWTLQASQNWGSFGEGNSSWATTYSGFERELWEGDFNHKISGMFYVSWRSMHTHTQPQSKKRFLCLTRCNLLIQGGKILTGGSVIESDGNFVQPTIVEISSDASVVKEELFGPVLYVMKIKVVLTY